MRPRISIRGFVPPWVHGSVRRSGVSQISQKWIPVDNTGGPQIWLAGPEAWLAGPEVWLAGPGAYLARSEAYLAGPQASQGGTNKQTDERTNGQTDGLTKKSPHSNRLVGRIIVAFYLHLFSPRTKSVVSF